MAIKMRTCGKCALRNADGGCPIFNIWVDSDQQGCPAYTAQKIACELCNNVIIGSRYLFDTTKEDEIHVVCENCTKYFGHCPSCAKSKTCLFETDPSDIPKVIQQQFRQGNMIQVATVKNPSRIEITCKKGCPCFDPEFGCSREINCCANYKIVYEKENLPDEPVQS